MSRLKDPDRIIPVTSLRHLYHLMRWTSDAFHFSLANEFQRRTDRLQELIDASYAHFSRYDNQVEPFNPRFGTLTEDRHLSRDPADRILVPISRGSTSVPECPNVEFDFVDYNVSPIRTTLSEFETGVPSTRSGRGGIDVLLASRTDRTPVVGELKGGTDRNLFFAFVQALTYAVELATPPQQARLELAYPGRFCLPTPCTPLDIALITIDYPDSEKSARFLEVLRELVAKLLPHSPFSRMVRRVTCLRTTEGQINAAYDGGTLEFRVEFDSTPSPPAG